MRICLYTCFLLLFFLFQVFNLELWADDNLELWAGDKIMLTNQLESSFFEIEKCHANNRIEMYFKLSESLDLGPHLKKGIVQQDKNQAFFLDYIKLLKKKPLDRQIEILNYCIKQKSAKYRGLYCYYLAQTKDISSIDNIIKLINLDENENVIKALQYYDHPKVIAVLVDKLLNGKSPKVRYVAAGSLGIIKNKISIPFLKEALHDNESANFPSASVMDENTVSSAATRALNKITDKKLTAEEWEKIDFKILLKE